MTSTARYSVLLAVIFTIDSHFLSLAIANDEVTNQNDPFTKVHSATEEKGLTFSAEYTGEVFDNLSGGLKKGETYEGLLKLSLQLDLTKAAGWNGAIIYGSMLYPHGEGITDRYTGDFNRLSNIDAYDSVGLFELWFQQKLFGDLFSIRIGQIAVDQEFYQSTTSNLFINSCFGTFPTIGFGTNLPAYPVGGLGARIEYRQSVVSLFAPAYSIPIEASYRIQLNEHLYLQPDVQYILYPGGFGAHPNAFVSGLRFDVTF